MEEPKLNNSYEKDLSVLQKLLKKQRFDLMKFRKGLKNIRKLKKNIARTLTKINKIKQLKYL